MEKSNNELCFWRELNIAPTELAWLFVNQDRIPVVLSLDSGEGGGGGDVFFC